MELKKSQYRILNFISFVDFPLIHLNLVSPSFLIKATGEYNAMNQND